MKSKLGLAIAITSEAFKNKTDKGGVPYIMHCWYVMEHAEGDDDEKCAYMMHDLIEDTDENSPINYTLGLLLDLGFSNRTIEILGYMTHNPEDTYDEYIAIIGKDLSSIKGKKADLKHNSCITRLKGLRDKDFERIKKYNKSYVYLTEQEKLFI